MIDSPEDSRRKRIIKRTVRQSIRDALNAVRERYSQRHADCKGRWLEVQPAKGEQLTTNTFRQRNVVSPEKRLVSESRARKIRETC